MYYHKFQPELAGLRAEHPVVDTKADMSPRHATLEALALVPKPPSVTNCSLWAWPEALRGMQYAFKSTPGWRKPSKLAFYIDEDAPFWATMAGYF